MNLDIFIFYISINNNRVRIAIAYNLNNRIDLIFDIKYILYIHIYYYIILYIYILSIINYECKYKIYLLLSQVFYAFVQIAITFNFYGWF